MTTSGFDIIEALRAHEAEITKEMLEEAMRNRKGGSVQNDYARLIGFLYEYHAESDFNTVKLDYDSVKTCGDDPFSKALCDLYVCLRDGEKIKNETNDALKGLFRAAFLNFNSDRNSWIQSHPFDEEYKGFKITPLGGGDYIGANSYILTYKGRSLMLDCGLNQNETGGKKYPLIDRYPNGVDAIVVSHGHLDHCGSLPKAHARWNVPIYCTGPTKDFTGLLFDDMIKISSKNAEKSGDNDSGILDAIDIEKSEMDATLKAMKTIGYSKWIQVFPGYKDCRIRLHPAGHIDGAAMVEIYWDGLTIVFTGDYCMNDQLFTKGAVTDALPRKPDLLISEATYAMKYDEGSWQNKLEGMKAAILKALIKEKPVLLPCFALGKSQELVCAIGKMADEGIIPEDVNLYIKGMAWKACDIAANGENGVVLKKYRRFFKRLREDMVPEAKSITIASSGMLTKGSASYHIAEDLKAEYGAGGFSILFSGYINKNAQEEIERQLGVKINKKRFSLSAHSAQADIDDLIMELSPKSIMLVHWGNSDDPEQDRRRYLKRLRGLLHEECLTHIAKDLETVYPCDPCFWLKSSLEEESYA